jgi:hypothetical protein
MPRPPAKFTQADIARAIRAIEQTGAKMEIRIETDGTIRIVPFVDDRPAKKPGKWPNRPSLSL